MLRKCPQKRPEIFGLLYQRLEGKYLPSVNIDQEQITGACACACGLCLSKVMYHFHKVWTIKVMG